MAGVSLSLSSRALTSITCGDSCTYKLVESIPEELVFADGSISTTSTTEAWLDLIKNAQSEIDVAAFYWNLGTDPDANGAGNQVLSALVLAAKRGIKIRIAQNVATNEFSQFDSQMLASLGFDVKVRSLDFTKVFGGGVLHTKFILVDKKAFYVGSANMDWTSLTQVKEIGAWVSECPCVAQDLSKIFEVYWTFGGLGSTLPSGNSWAESLMTKYNEFHRMLVSLSGEKGSVFFSSAPPALNVYSRTQDLDAILHTIKNATKTVCVSVMDYYPVSLYTPSGQQRVYFPEINDAIANAVISQGVKVRMLISKWNSTKPAMYQFLDALQKVNSSCQALGKSCTGSIDIRMFVVPPLSDGTVYPFTRVNHAKYLVTENESYIGTSNWTWDYFFTTAGVGFISTHQGLTQTLQAIFDRDWSSQYAFSLSQFL